MKKLALLITGLLIAISASDHRPVSLLLQLDKETSNGQR